MLRFSVVDLRPVFVEARTNGCRVILVKDHGVYLMSEQGERLSDGRQKHLAYAVGCNPDVDPFDEWYERARDELGGDDFGEYLEAGSPLFTRVLDVGCDLLVRATPTHLHFEAASTSS